MIINELILPMAVDSVVTKHNYRFIIFYKQF